MSRFWIHLLQTEIHLAAGRFSEAESALERASGMERERRDVFWETLTRARLRRASGDRPGALAAYRTFVGLPTLNEFFIVQKTRALYELARLEEESGDRPAAMEHYREYLARWGDADMPIAEVPEARARLAALESR